MAKRRSDDARTLLDRAREEAGGLHADYVGTEHLLLALLSDGGPAGDALRTLGVSAGDVRERAAGVRPPAEPVASRMGLTARSERVLELAAELAEERGAGQADPRDVLIALVRGDGGPGARILRDLGVSADRVEDAVEEATAG